MVGTKDHHMRMYFSGVMNAEFMNACVIARSSYVMLSKPFINKSLAAAALSFPGHVIIDSGAYGVQRKGTFDTRQLDLYTDEYLAMMEAFPRSWSLVELDIEKTGVPMTEVDRIFRRLVRESGRYVIRVWHPERGIRAFERYVDSGLPLIGLAYRDGARMAKGDLARMVYYAYERGTLIHLFMGGVPSKLLDAPYYSADASSWARAPAYGQVWYHDPRTMRPRMSSRYPLKSGNRVNAGHLARLDLRDPGRKAANPLDLTLECVPYLNVLEQSANMVSRIWERRGYSHTLRLEELTNEHCDV